MKPPIKILASAILTSGILAATANAQLALNDTYEVPSDPNNGRLSQGFSGENPTGSYSYAAAPSIEVRPAGNSPGRRMSNGIFYFQLPEIGSGLSIGNATLSFWLQNTNGNGPGIGNVDLYGLGFRSTAAIATNERADFWFMPEIDNEKDARFSLIQDALIPASAFPEGLAAVDGPVEFTTNTGVDVYLNSLYDAGAQPGDYAVFRLNYSAKINPNGTIYGYTVRGSGATPAGTDPTLAFTVIPEPSTVALFSGLAALAIAALVRRRARS